MRISCTLKFLKVCGTEIKHKQTEYVIRGMPFLLGLLFGSTALKPRLSGYFNFCFFVWYFRSCDHFILGTEHLWVDVGTGVPVRYFEPSFGFQVRIFKRYTASYFRYYYNLLCFIISARTAHGAIKVDLAFVYTIP